ncbi:Coenzyme F420 hydrogenase/dehydrogenase, beta subunit C-terminal domain [Methanospirillum lacunae]|uniref:4Fe-4S ferredoxin n=1 Tax=Methanospirillum lacunae TaxID=668570 RepID=A0A2V2N2C1_9EURY|nr:Coenzyme F420 hydrogenase/dehydrogenase, beta subunit C-terminal domain [Methanospirillum lacunae]PWR72770.1 4Fe-4S ferredoxin [Methanospirillum lacunae]
MKPLFPKKDKNLDLCIGCGVCVALCPDNSLKMIINPYGEYNPVLYHDCKTECGICINVCPFGEKNPDEDVIGQQLFGNVPGIQHKLETGFFLNTYVGYSKVNEHRNLGASGGMATWILENLIKDHEVDAVICVTKNLDPNKLFKYTVFSSIEDIRKSSGSTYHPVELSEVLKYIVDIPGNYAIIGLPCFVKAIRLSQLYNKKLRKRITIILGLTCGQLKSVNYTTYLSTLAGLEEKPIQVQYRGKDSEKIASNFFFSAMDKKGKEKKLFWNEGVAEAYLNRWFTINACNYCDDIFAECADVTLMDAWLPEYSLDSKGTNLILIRSIKVKRLLEKGIMLKDINLDTIPIDMVIQSQKGLITIKRKYLAFRLYLNKKNGKKVVKKRVNPVRMKNPFLRNEVIYKEQMRIISRTYKKGENDIFRDDMEPILHLLRKNETYLKIIMLPIDIIQFFQRKIRSLLYES